MDQVGTDSLWTLIEAAHRSGVERAMASSSDFTPFGLVSIEGAEAGQVVAPGQAVAGRPLDEQIAWIRETLGTVARKPEAGLFSAAIVYDSYFAPEGDDRKEAVAIEAYERGLPAGVLVVQPYTRKRALRKGKIEGKSVMLRQDLETIF